jgi:pimeloyl-ACP methyl ester carboxylesterase
VHGHVSTPAFPEKIASCTFIGVPSGFEGIQQVPFQLRLLAGSFIGSYLMSGPPPESMPRDMFKDFFQQNMEIVPEPLIAYYKEVMSLRNNSLSWNHLLRVFGQKGFFWRIQDLKELNEKYPCLLILGPSDDLASAKQRQEMATYYPTEGYVELGQGHLPNLEASQEIADKLIDFIHPPQ